MSLSVLKLWLTMLVTSLVKVTEYCKSFNCSGSYHGSDAQYSIAWCLCIIGGGGVELKNKARSRFSKNKYLFVNNLNTILVDVERQNKKPDKSRFAV